MKTRPKLTNLAHSRPNNLYKNTRRLNLPGEPQRGAGAARRTRAGPALQHAMMTLVIFLLIMAAARLVMGPTPEFYLFMMGFSALLLAAMVCVALNAILKSWRERRTR